MIFSFSYGGGIDRNGTAALLYYKQRKEAVSLEKDDSIGLLFLPGTVPVCLFGSRNHRTGICSDLCGKPGSELPHFPGR